MSETQKACVLWWLVVVLNVFLIGFLYVLTPWFVADVFDGTLNAITLTSTH